MGSMDACMGVKACMHAIYVHRRSRLRTYTTGLVYVQPTTAMLSIVTMHAWGTREGHAKSMHDAMHIPHEASMTLYLVDNKKGPS